MIPTPSPIAPSNPSPTKAGVTREVWIANRTDGRAGAGTAPDPFDGSTALKFDALMRGFAVQVDGAGLPLPLRVHLCPGVIKTQGVQIAVSTFTFPNYDAGNYPYYVPEASVNSGWYIYSGWEIIGAGIGVTTLQLDSWPQWGGAPYPYGVYVIGSSDGSLGYWADDCTISDLTVDCNWQNLSASRPSNGHTVAAAIGLNGDRRKIERVHVINAYGNAASLNECFGVGLSGRSTSTYFQGIGYPDVTLRSVHDIVRDCICDSWRGDYGSPIAIDGGIVTGNYIHNWTPGTTAISCGSNSLIEDNRVDGCSTGFYLEGVPAVTDVTITNNRFWNCQNGGIALEPTTGGDIERMLITGNSIQIAFDSAASSSRTPWGIVAVHTNGTLKDIIIEGNVITHTGTQGAAPTYTPFGVNLDTITGVTVRNNITDTAFSNQLQSCTNVLCSGNRTTAQAVAPHLPDTPQIQFTASAINTSNQLIATGTETVIDLRGTVRDDGGLAKPPYFPVPVAGWYQVYFHLSGDNTDWHVEIYKNVGGTLSGSGPATISGGTSTIIGFPAVVSQNRGSFVTLVGPLNAGDILYLTAKQNGGGSANLYYDANSGTRVAFVPLP